MKHRTVRELKGWRPFDLYPTFVPFQPFPARQAPGKVGSNASEEMDLLARARAAGKEEKLPFSMSFYIGFQQKAQPRLEVDFLTSKGRIRGLSLGLERWLSG